MRPVLTDRFALSVSAGSKKIFYDHGPNRIPGLGLRVSPTAKSWVLNYTVAGRERRMTIGSFPAWPVAEARKRAAELRRLVDQGRDPLGERQADRRAPDFATLLEEYLEVIRGTKRAWRSYKGIIEQYLRPRWGSRKVGQITRADCRELHRDVTKTTPIRANRVLAVASSVFSYAMDLEIITDNPARGIRLNRENKRERYLDAGELARLWAVLRDWPDQVTATAIRLLLLTGCRRGELLGARWPEFDLAGGVWTKPLTKSGRSHRLPLSPEAVAELTRLPRHNSSEFLFPNTHNRRHWSTVRAWPEIRDAARLEGIHLHDLRHTGASILVSRGLSLPIIGGMLGHSQPATTARYAHLMDGAVRDAVGQLGQALVPPLPAEPPSLQPGD